MDTESMDPLLQEVSEDRGREKAEMCGPLPCDAGALPDGAGKAQHPEQSRGEPSLWIQWFGCCWM